MRISDCSISPDASSQNSPKGFTLIEILVTLGILGILSGILVGYAQESSRQTLMMVTREHLIRLFARAKSLSTSTYLSNVSSQQNQGQSKVCGYGLHVDRTPGKQKLFIFQSIDTNCNLRTDYAYKPFPNGQDKSLESDSSLNLYVIDASRLQLTTDPNGDLGDVVFVPPNPDTRLNDPSGAVITTQGGIKLQINDGSEFAEVDINNAGQISWK